MEENAYLTLFAAIALLAAKPGPGMMTVATKAVGEGLGAAASFMLGTAMAKLVFFTLVIAGYTLVPDVAAAIAVVLKSLTAAYLIWLGVRGLIKPLSLEDPATVPEQKTTFIENLGAGFMLTISNPFDIIFFTGIMPTILVIGAITPLQYFACALIIVMAYAMVAFSYAVPISLSRRFIKRGLIRKLTVVSSVGIILVGLYIGYSALTGLF